MKLRYVFFDEHGNARKVSNAAFNRVWNGTQALGEVAGQRIRFMTLQVELEQDRRTVAKLYRPDAFILSFDDHGFVDADEKLKQLHATLNNHPFLQRRSEGNVISARARFESARFRWNPTSEQVSAALAVHKLEFR